MKLNINNDLGHKPVYEFKPFQLKILKTKKSVNDIYKVYENKNKLDLIKIGLHKMKSWLTDNEHYYNFLIMSLDYKLKKRIVKKGGKNV